MRRIPLSLPLRLVLLISLVPAALGAQDDGASTEWILLLLPTGAQAIAMGRSVSAVAGAESVFWNPAGLAELTDAHVQLYRSEHAAGVATAASGLFSRPGIGTLGITYHLMDIGEQELRDDEQNVLGTISLRHHVGVVSVATRFLDRLNVGFNFKLVQFRESCRGLCLNAGVTATTYAVDAGVQLARVVGLPVRLGAMVAHAGPKFQIRNEEQADPLPTRVRFSAAYQIAGPEVPGAELSVELTGEVEDRWRDPGSPAVYMGSEFRAAIAPALLQLRAGYVIGNGEQVDGAAVGVGIGYNRFDLSIAKSLASNVALDTEPVHVTFGLIF